MNKQTETALKMAIEALAKHATDESDEGWQYIEAIQACKEALEQPELPDFCQNISLNKCEYKNSCKHCLIEQPAQKPVDWLKPIGLTTHPAPSWQKLSDDEIDGVWFEVVKENNFEGTGKYFARAIEQALREKNHG